jgi:hypothetical protein
LKIKAFGCSFIWGTDLSDAEYPHGSGMTWPALMARHRNLEYKNCAIGGIGNTQIAAMIATELGEDDNPDSIYVIQWTWADRFDYVDTDQMWQTLRPSLEMPHADYYYRHLQSEFLDRFTSLQSMAATVSLLNQLNQKFIMTALDTSLSDSVDPAYFHPSILDSYWKMVQPHLHWFQGLDFLSWSRKHGFSESALCHPLESAHQSATELMLPVIDAILHRA